ncbi:MAG: protein kinase [Planctomycetota bacterium]|jgi:serine/threonine protein kinase|nr:protein kinase [Planctomycetota bacterium]
MASKEEILLGQIALQEDLISSKALDEALTHQESHPHPPPLGEVFLKLGYLNPEQLQLLLQKQKIHLQNPDPVTGIPRGENIFGQLLLKRGLISPKVLHECVRIQGRLTQSGQPKSLGSILVSRGHLTEDQLDEILLQQKQIVSLVCTPCKKRLQIVSYDPSKIYSCRECQGPLTRPDPLPATSSPDPLPQENISPHSEEVRRIVPVEVEQDASDAFLFSLYGGPEGYDAPDLPPPSPQTFEIKTPVEIQDDLCGTRLAGYQILSQIGHGAMGVIYKAKQISLDRIVCVKLLAPQLANHPDFLSRFRREAMAVARLNHPHIVQIFDVCEDQGRHFYSMEYVSGENCRHIQERIGQMTARQGFELLCHLANALQEAHRADLVHRDIKPDNIMVTSKGQAKLADLGIAKSLLSSQDASITDEDILLGTPYYMSPEQASSPETVDHRADIYSLGATFYHLFAGKPPFSGINPESILDKLTHQIAPPLESYRPDLPPGLVALIERSMRKSPNTRYQDATELIDALDSLSDSILSGRSRRIQTRQFHVIEPEAVDISGLQIIEDTETTGNALRHLPLQVPAEISDLKPTALQDTSPRSNSSTHSTRNRITNSSSRASSRKPTSNGLPLKGIAYSSLVILAGIFLFSQQREKAQEKKLLEQEEETRQSNIEQAQGVIRSILSDLNKIASPKPTDIDHLLLRLGALEKDPKFSKWIERDLYDLKSKLLASKESAWESSTKEKVQKLCETQRYVEARRIVSHSLNETRNMPRIAPSLRNLNMEIDRQERKRIRQAIQSARTQLSKKQFQKALELIQLPVTNFSKNSLQLLVTLRTEITRQQSHWLQTQKNNKTQTTERLIAQAQSRLLPFRLQRDRTPASQALTTLLNSPDYSPIAELLRQERSWLEAPSKIESQLIKALKNLSRTVQADTPFLFEFRDNRGRVILSSAQKILQVQPKRNRIMTDKTIIHLNRLTPGCVAKVLSTLPNPQNDTYHIRLAEFFLSRQLLSAALDHLLAVEEETLRTRTLYLGLDLLEWAAKKPDILPPTETRTLLQKYLESFSGSPRLAPLQPRIQILVKRLD